MRILLLAMPVVLALCVPNAGAQSKDDYPLTGSDAVSTVRVQAPPPEFRVSDGDTGAIAGAYRMSNGWRLQVESGGNGIEARIDRQRSMHLIALGPSDYVTRDGNVAMTFNLGKDGDEMLMSYVPSSSLRRVTERVVLRSGLAAR